MTCEANKYGYFVSGHVRLHPPVVSQGRATGHEPFTAPYSGYISITTPICSQGGLDALTKKAEDDIKAEMGQKYAVGELILRTVNLIYRPEYSEGMAQNE
jgi:hypothetical protein